MDLTAIGLCRLRLGLRCATATCLGTVLLVISTPGAATTGNGIERGRYSCRIGNGWFVFAITDDRICRTGDITVRPQDVKNCTYSINPATRELTIADPPVPELYRNSLTYVPRGNRGSQANMSGPGFEVFGFTLDIAARSVGWCQYMER